MWRLLVTPNLENALNQSGERQCQILNLLRYKRGIDDQLEAIRVQWLRLVTADFDALERKEVRNQITNRRNSSHDVA